MRVCVLMIVGGVFGTAPARAASVTLAAGTMTVSAASNEVLDLAVRPDGATSVEIDFGTTPPTPPLGCTADDVAITCPASALSLLRVFGAAGDDRITLRGSVALEADGGAGDDTIRGGDAADTIDGADGDDDVDGRGGDDTLSGGAGADQLSGAAGADRIDGGAGDDLLDGGEGSDTLDGGQAADTLLGADGADTLTGGDGDDQLDGGDDDDQLDGGAGDDLLRAGLGDDALVAGAGADHLDGEAGDDQLRAGEDADTAIGGPGADVISGGGGEDSLAGGAGDDTLDAGDGNDDLDGETGRDALTGGSGNDQLDGGEDEDRLDGQEGRDTLTAGLGDELTGGTGLDTVDVSDADRPLDVDLTAGTVRRTGGDLTRLLDVPEVLLGGAFDDVLRASATAGSMLVGNGGDDTLIGGPFADQLDGGDGRDTADYSSRTVPTAVHADGMPTSGSVGEGDRVMENVETLVGGSGNDDLVGAAGPSALIGGPGDDRLEDLLDGEIDTLNCGDGNDTAYADRGNDQVDASCERWSNGVQMLRSNEPISVGIRSPRLAIDRHGRMRISLACSRDAVEQCRALVTVQLRHGGKWRRGPARSVLLTPGRRRSITVFAQRGFKQLLAGRGLRGRALVHVDARDAIGRTASDQRELRLDLPLTNGGGR